MKVDYHLFVNRHLPPQERGCTSKSRFVSRRDARSQARNSRHADGQLKPYRCRFCDGWHLGHNRRKELARR